MQTKILGSGNQGAIAPAELAVDPLFLAARIAIRPLDYTGAGRVLGFYRAVCQTSAIAPTANVILSALRWTDPGSFLVLMGLRAELHVATAVTAQRLDPITAAIARAYTARDLTNATAITISGNNQKLRTTPMGSSLVANLDVASAAGGVTGGTKTADANPFGMAGLSGAAIAALGTGQLPQDIYRALPVGGHPPVLAVNEGILVNWGATTLATGTVVAALEYEWAEVVVY